MDFIVDLPKSKGMDTILVVVDRFSKQAHFIPLKGLPSAPKLAEVFVKVVFRLHGSPQTIVSDRGSQFVSKFWRAFCKKLNVALHFSSGYHPQTNGQTERTNQSLEQFLHCFISDSQDNWLDLLPWAEFAHNNLRNESTLQSPFLSNFGFHPSTLPQSGPSTGVPAAEERIRDLQASWSRIQDNLKWATAMKKKQADRHRQRPPDFAPGQKVWLSTKNIRLKVTSPKLAPRFIGPFPILKRINPVTYRLKLPATMKIPSAFHCSLLKPFVPNPQIQHITPSPRLVNGQEEFEVQSILDSRISRGGLQYLVHWRGFGPEERAWIPQVQVHAPRLVRAFHSKFPLKPGKDRPESDPEGGGTVRPLPAAVLTSAAGARGTRSRGPPLLPELPAAPARRRGKAARAPSAPAFQSGELNLPLPSRARATMSISTAANVIVPFPPVLHPASAYQRSTYI
ncbi:hypothetical protein FKM82_027115 [Ascaphus truei]